MTMSIIWIAMLAAGILFGVSTGRTAEVGAAALQGAAEAVELALRMAGGVAFWSALTELLRQSGLAAALSRFLAPLLRRFFPKSCSDSVVRESISENFTANLLGLGNAATPAGIRAATRMRELSGGDTASDELVRLVVLNTASVQLIPGTVAALRAAAGAAAPMDILPCVWLTSLAALSVGLLAERGFSRLC